MAHWLATLVVIAVIFTTNNFVKCTKQKKSRESVNIQLEQKVQNLVDLNSRRPVIRMNGDKYRQYVKTSPKNYSIILMLTALSPQRQCAICKEVNSEYQILASSWRYSNGFTSNKLFFAMVDFDEGSDVFQALKLNSAPVIMHFPARGPQKKVDTYDMGRQGFAAEQLAKWVLDRTDVSIHIMRPPNYVMAMTIGVLLALIGALLYVKRKSLEVFYNRDYWAIFALIIVFIMISGQMWNHIRGPPYAHRNPQTGEIAYIHGSSDGQLIAETYIVFVLYGCISTGFILLNDNAMSQNDPKKRKMFTIIGLAIIVLFFSLILSVFRGKYHGYPYSFLIK
ncbi:tumor suppressor candidate 3 [Hydra vulgaris]|uniref:Tumor suppressor candidate 3 n=1 Tax=Hydra vulgaris TaxID=6087 RepID=A0ABM4CZL3_HYDVU|nr:tumor suppressor candidate 3 [Hydra vulgaris]